MTSEFNPAHPRQRKVHDGAIGLEGLSKRERTRTVARDGHLVAPDADQSGDRRPDLFVIVDDQYSPHALCHDLNANGPETFAPAARVQGRCRYGTSTIFPNAPGSITSTCACGACASGSRSEEHT